MSRSDWDTYFFEIARTIATRATCDRAHVGAVIVRDRCIIATGYNGSLPGAPHCDDVGHDMVDGHCLRTVHAEANAIAQAARRGAALEGSTIYCTHRPCRRCEMLAFAAGIRFIMFDQDYIGRDREAEEEDKPPCEE